MAYNACDPTIYWIGTTAEAFKIAPILNESSDLTIDPNSGSNGTGETLDLNWVMTNFNAVNRFTFRGDAHHEINTITGHAHALIIVPVNLAISGIGESVLGTIADMTEGLHYDAFTIINGAQEYTCYYFRDLTNLVFQKRQFQFDIKLT